MIDKTESKTKSSSFAIENSSSFASQVAHQMPVPGAVSISAQPEPEPEVAATL